mgnify:CR=1 FL=1
MKVIRVFALLVSWCLLCASCGVKEEFQMGIQLGAGLNKGIVFYVKDASINAVLCQINEVNFQIEEITERSESRALSSDEMEKVNEYLEKIKDIQDTEFLDPGIKGRPFMTLYYKNRRYCADFHTDTITGYPYGEGYKILNEFADYVATLMPEFVQKLGK